MQMQIIISCYFNVVKVLLRNSQFKYKCSALFFLDEPGLHNNKKNKQSSNQKTLQVCLEFSVINYIHTHAYTHSCPTA